MDRYNSKVLYTLITSKMILRVTVTLLCVAFILIVSSHFFSLDPADDQQPLRNPDITEEEGGAKSSFSLTPCRGVGGHHHHHQPVNVSSISLLPDPIVLPGVLAGSFDIVFRDTDNVNVPTDGVSRLKMHVKMEYHLMTSGLWVKIPCVGGVGSCVYEDFCDVVGDEVCYNCEFEDPDMPCKCPFTKGRYKLTPVEFEVPISSLLSGRYRATFRLTQQEEGEQLACYVMNLKIA